MALRFKQIKVEKKITRISRAVIILYYARSAEALKFSACVFLLKAL